MKKQNLKQYLSNLLLEYETFKEYSRLDTSLDWFVEQYIKKHGHPALMDKTTECNHIGSDGIPSLKLSLTGKTICRICGNEVKSVPRNFFIKKINRCSSR